MESTCHACLSKGRNLHYFRDMQGTLDWQNIGVKTRTGGVCWECKAVMRNYQILRKKAAQAQAIITEDMVTDSQCLSTLTKSIVLNLEDTTGRVETLVKIESLNDDTDIDVVKQELGETFDKEIDLASVNEEEDIFVLEKPMDEAFGDDVYDKIDDDDFVGGNKSDTDDDSNKNNDNENIKDNGNKNDDIGNKKNDNVNKNDDNINKKDKKRKKKDKGKDSDSKKVKNKKKKKDDSIKSDDDNGEAINAKLHYYKLPITKEELMKMRERDKNLLSFKKAVHKCYSCIVTFASEKLFFKHNRQNHTRKIGPHMCEICFVCIANTEKLRHHEIGHMSQFSCERCPYRHYSLANMDSHIRDNHKQEVYSCDKCELTFKSKRFQKNHIYTAHLGPYECDLCGKIMKSKANLQQHLRLTHEEKMIECEVCQGKFRGRKSFRYHMLSHSKRERDLSYCAECNIQFDNRYKYRTHLKGSKHGEPENQCPHCNRKFTDKKYVKRHIDIVHLNKTDFPCEICNKKFSTRSNLRIHVLTVHEGSTANKKHNCNLCDRTFTSKHGLKGHMNSHTGERPFKCSKCLKSFAQNGGLYKHKQRVHKMKRLKDCQKKIDSEVVESN